MKILGIETSCDETAAAVVKGSRGYVRVLSNIVSSQIDIHRKYGGIVPEVAAREHVLQILPVINEALTNAGIIPPLAKGRWPRQGGGRGVRGGINAIAVTAGPGLITSLIVGIETAKVLSYAWNIPVIGINHIEGHIYANFINKQQKIKLPALILTISGGHTMLVLMQGYGKYKIIGETRDDAAGEAFDKAAKLLGIGYPGGPVISKKAEKNKSKTKNSNINLPRPMIEAKNFDFSFSGLKTALLYKLKEDRQWRKKIPQYCHEFQQAVIDVLINKTIRAANELNIKTVMLTGGVAANKELRQQLKKAVKELKNTQFIMPREKNIYRGKSLRLIAI